MALLSVSPSIAASGRPVTYIPRDAGRDSIINAAGWAASASRHKIWVVSDRTFRRLFVQPIVFTLYYAETFSPVRL